MPLATPERYSQILNRDAAAPDAASRLVLAGQLEAVSDYLERELDREFLPAKEEVGPSGEINVAASIREYPAPLGCFLTVHDCQAKPTAVRIDTKGKGVYDVTLEASDYRVRPLNAARRRPARPFERLEMLSNPRAKTWGCTVEVTAPWGWPAVPAAIEQLTIQLVGILRNATPLATSEISDVGAVIGASKEARHLIHQLGDAYRRQPEPQQVQTTTWFA